MTAGRLGDLYSSIVHDVLRAQGLVNQVLPYDIRPLSDGMVVAGPVFTVNGRLDSSISDDDSLLAWTEFLTVAPEGSVVMLQANDHNYSHMGELSAETLLGRGVSGFITDGGTRDVKMVREIGFPVWCRYATPSDIVGRWTIESTGQPIVIGGVDIAVGDQVIADDDGVVIVPGEVAEDVINEAERLVSSEDAVRSEIRAGVSPKEAYLKHRKF